jgi:hypothetical protein
VAPGATSPEPVIGKEAVAGELKLPLHKVAPEFQERLDRIKEKYGSWESTPLRVTVTEGSLTFDIVLEENKN